MQTLILESENEYNLKLIQQLAEQLNIHCRIILQKTKSNEIHQKSTPQEKTKKRRVFGQHRGLCKMSEDFNEELPDNFWLGE